MYLTETYAEDTESVSLTDDQKTQLITDAQTKRRLWLDMTRDYRQTALEVRQLYLENRPEVQQFTSAASDLDAKSRVRMPVMAQSVDSTLAQQHLGTYPTDERFFKAHPRNELSKEKQLVYEDSTENRMSKLCFIQKTKMDRLNAMLDGVSVVWHPFCRKSRKRAIYTPRKIFGIPIGGNKKRYEEQVFLEGTDFIPLNLEDWWIDPTVDSFDECNFIWRQWVHPEYLKTIEGFENTEEAKPASAVYDDTEGREQQNYEYMGFTLTDAEKQMGAEMVMLFEEWGDFYIDGNLYENHVLVYSNEAVFHGFFPNPFDHGYKPFSIGSYNPTPGTLMGKSLGRDIVPLAHAYDAFLNGAIDIVNSSAGPIWTYLTTDASLVEYFSEGPVVLVPGMTVPVQNHDSLRPFQTDLQNLGVIAQLMGRVKEEIRESTGGVPYATGGLSGEDPERTATEVNTLASGTSTRYQDVIQNYEEFKLKRFLWMWFENDRQFMSEPVFVESEPITPEMVKQMDFEFEVIGSKTAMSQSREANALMQIIGMLPQLFQLGTFQPKTDRVSVDIGGMLQQIGRSQGARNINDYLEVIATEEEIQEQGGGLEELINGLGQVDAGGPPVDLGAIQAGANVAAAETGTGA